MSQSSYLHHMWKVVGTVWEHTKKRKYRENGEKNVAVGLQ